VPTKRDQILQTTCRLLEAQGFHATGINQIIAESGAPKGSLYHYFPEGKDGLAGEAIERIGREVRDRIRCRMASVDDPAEAIESLIRAIAGHLASSGFKRGGPLTTVALESATANDLLNRACRGAYRSWQDAFAAKLRESGYSEDDASAMSALIVASIEGAILLSRTYHSTEPVEQVADQLGDMLRARRAIA
jgi:TetR/AcrR family transcriptional regulator, lmrAB and yxaGH operons repressor